MRLLISLCLLAATAAGADAQTQKVKKTAEQPGQKQAQPAAASAPGITEQRFKGIQQQEAEKLAAAISAMQKLRDCFAASRDIEEMRRCGSAYAEKAASAFASFCSFLPGAHQSYAGMPAVPGNPWMPAAVSRLSGTGGANLPPQNSGDFKGHP